MGVNPRNDRYIGERFGRLVVIKPEEKRGRSKIYTCKCDCGNTKNVFLGNLKRARTVSCGCYHREVVRTGKHNGRRTRLYSIWTNMKTRCRNHNVPGYKDYGGRGIRGIDSWEQDFRVFKKWADESGYSDDLTLERVDVNGGYSPDNCIWVPSRDQSLNKRNSIRVNLFGVTKTLKEWSALIGINYKTVHARITRGMEPTEALLKRVRNKK